MTPHSDSGTAHTPTERERLAMAIERLAASQVAAARPAETVSHADIHAKLGALTGMVTAHVDGARERHETVLSRFDKGAERMGHIERRVGDIEADLTITAAEERGAAGVRQARRQRLDRVARAAGVVARNWKAIALVVGGLGWGALEAVQMTAQRALPAAVAAVFVAEGALADDDVALQSALSQLRRDQ